MPSESGYSAAQIWEAALAQLLLRVTRQNYDTWLRSTAGLRFEATTLVVATPNELTSDWLRTRMHHVVNQAITAVAGAGLSLSFEASADSTRIAGESPRQPGMLPRPALSLNPRYTFESFLAADHNSLALSAAHDVAGAASRYSPLFITGSSGNGKTHLLHAIAHEARAAGTSLLLVGADQFLNEYTTAIRTNTGAAFRHRYRDIEMLLIDDAHRLLGKKATLSEFYQTIAGLGDEGRGVAVAGDVSAMNGDAVRFQSELHWGLVASIEPPTVEDRVRFIGQKAASHGFVLSDEVQHYLALRIRSSIRDLEGAVNRVTAVARLSREPITIDFAARALQPVSTAPTQLIPALGPTDVLQAVSDHLKVTIAEIKSQRRDRTFTYARHIAMYLMRQDSGLTYSAIAQVLGKKDHSTVVHACTQVHKELKLSPSLRADIDAIRTAGRSIQQTLAS